jgi:uncharacterized protein (UPF0335 family)
MVRSALIIAAASAVVLAVGGNYLFAQSFSASQIHQLIAKVDRLERELATARREMVELRRRYTSHVHRLNARTLEATKLRATTRDMDKLELLVRDGPGDATMTRAPK